MASPKTALDRSRTGFRTDAAATPKAPGRRRGPSSSKAAAVGRRFLVRYKPTASGRATRKGSADPACFAALHLPVRDAASQVDHLFTDRVAASGERRGS